MQHLAATFAACSRVSACAITLVLALEAQGAAEFEVASVKVSQPLRPGVPSRCLGGPGTTNPGTFTCESFQLSSLVLIAYNLRPFQFSGPGWMNTERYDIVAKIPPGTTNLQFRLMLQSLLAKRFDLAFHYKTIETTVYDLTVAKGGPKLTKAEGELAPQEGPVWTSRLSPPGRTQASRIRKAESIPVLADFLSAQLDGPVIDDTGLSDLYDYTLSWLIDPAGRGPAVLLPDAPVGSSPRGDFVPTLVEAVRNQLGLALTAKKGQAQTFVVDHAERVPVEN
jgi:uncharacterized protein (TIGR03435 family)